MSPSVLVRDATIDDLDEVARLFIELKHHHRQLQPHNPRYEVGDSAWRDTARRALESPATIVYVAELDESVAGFVNLRLVEKPWGVSCEIDTLVVTEGARGKGCGVELMRAAEDYAHLAGARGIRVDVLITNEGGRAFYEQLGYEAFALRYGKATTVLPSSG
ncbi:MAG: N-acetyltransferase family protein [Actinomycetota bacterium]